MIRGRVPSRPCVVIYDVNTEPPPPGEGPLTCLPSRTEWWSITTITTTTITRTAMIFPPSTRTVLWCGRIPFTRIPLRRRPLPTRRRRHRPPSSKPRTPRRICVNADDDDSPWKEEEELAVAVLIPIPRCPDAILYNGPIRVHIVEDGFHADHEITTPTSTTTTTANHYLYTAVTPRAVAVVVVAALVLLEEC